MRFILLNSVEIYFNTSNDFFKDRLKKDDEHIDDIFRGQQKVTTRSGSQGRQELKSDEPKEC